MKKVIACLILISMFLIGCERKQKLNVQERPQMPDYANEASRPPNRPCDK